MDNKETARSDYEKIKKERKEKRKSFWITPTW
jgi:hypothetical protein